MRVTSNSIFLAISADFICASKTKGFDNSFLRLRCFLYVCSKSTFNSSAIVLDDQQLAFPKQCTTKLEHSEPVGPCMSTCVPGPESKHLTHELANIQNTSAIHFFVNYEKSYGNYVVDADGNIILDAFTQIASLPLGYNHPRLLSALSNPKNVASFVTRPALGSYPPIDLIDKLKSTFLTVAPPGLKHVQTMSCGSCSVEHAQKAMFMAYKKRERDGTPPTEEDLISCVRGKEPGSPKLSILSFMGAFHGRGMGALACSHAKWFHKLDFPVPDWPVASFPRLQYPLCDFEQVNRLEEGRCLEQVEDLFEEYGRKSQSVVGIITEPLQSEGGDNHASPGFFQGLQDIAMKNNAYMLMDEVQTGCGVSGKFWAHEHFALSRSVDIVTFSKKMLTGGFFFKEELMPSEGYRIYNTWMGDPSKIVLLDEVLRVVREEDLVSQAKVTGDYLLKNLVQLCSLYPGIIRNARGLGTLCAVDFKNVDVRNAFVALLRNKGVNTGSCGEAAMRIRPSLLFNKSHAAIFLSILETALRDHVVRQ